MTDLAWFVVGWSACCVALGVGTVVELLWRDRQKRRAVGDQHSILHPDNRYEYEHYGTLGGPHGPRPRSPFGSS